MGNYQFEIESSSHQVALASNPEFKAEVATSSYQHGAVAEQPQAKKLAVKPRASSKIMAVGSSVPSVGLPAPFPGVLLP